MTNIALCVDNCESRLAENDTGRDSTNDDDSGSALIADPIKQMKEPLLQKKRALEIELQGTVKQLKALDVPHCYYIGQPPHAADSAVPLEYKMKLLRQRLREQGWCTATLCATRDMRIDMHDDDEDDGDAEDNGDDEDDDAGDDYPYPPCPDPYPTPKDVNRWYGGGFLVNIRCRFCNARVFSCKPDCPAEIDKKLFDCNFDEWFKEHSGFDPNSTALTF